MGWVYLDAEDLVIWSDLKAKGSLPSTEEIDKAMTGGNGTIIPITEPHKNAH